MDPMELVKSIGRQGEGSSAIIIGSRGNNKMGHAFNLVYQNGTIKFLDGQTGNIWNVESLRKEFTGGFICFNPKT